jgi:superfamily I DNA/RNA helicase
MDLTEEQIAITKSTGNIKINAVAGSGKTTTLIEYARTRPKASRILYLAFNKSVKLEAQRKFTEKGLTNVRVETAHSLAYRYIVHDYGYSIRPNGYTTHEIADILGLKGNGEKHAEFIIANHINRFIAYFCNSAAQKVQQLDYRKVVTEPKAKKFVESFYDYIEKQTRVLLGKMDAGKMDITHDFYLKKFQLSTPVLPYDYILFDEGQDASPAMVDVFAKQPATKVIVGDTHQQIYGFRFAVNALEQVNFPTFHLSHSFRFNQDIAALAMNVLAWKKHIKQPHQLSIVGKGGTDKLQSKAVIGRTNLGLLLRVITYMDENEKTDGIYFEGNISSYTYADDGASLYDVLSLYNDNRFKIKDPLIKSMKDLYELEEYIEKTGDVQLSMMVEIVKKYGNRIPGIIKSIKDKHISDDDKHKATIIFSTVHRCKGMEYDSVELVHDFINEENLQKNVQDLKEQPDAIAALGEEVNLLYVAITRTKGILHIPEKLLPENQPESKSIDVLPANPFEKANDALVDFKPGEFKSKKRNRYAQKNTGAHIPEEEFKRYTKDKFDPWKRRQ